MFTSGFARARLGRAFLQDVVQQAGTNDGEYTGGQAVGKGSTPGYKLPGRRLPRKGGSGAGGNTPGPPRYRVTVLVLERKTGPATVARNDSALAQEGNQGLVQQGMAPRPLAANVNLGCRFGRLSGRSTIDLLPSKRNAARRKNRTRAGSSTSPARGRRPMPAWDTTLRSGPGPRSMRVKGRHEKADPRRASPII